MLGVERRKQKENKLYKQKREIKDKRTNSETGSKEEGVVIKKDAQKAVL